MKKKKSNTNKDDEQTNELEIAATKAWEHYRNYNESCENEEGEEDGDTDELLELLEVVLKPFMDSNQIRPLKQLSAATTTSTSDVVSLLPILISVSYYHLADIAIGEYLESKQQTQAQAQSNQGEGGGEQQGDGKGKSLHVLCKRCQDLIYKSLYWYEANASMWSMAANFGRMFQLLTPTAICAWYEKAIDCAVTVRKVSLQLLNEEQQEDDNNAVTTTSTSVSPQAKEWIELLLLNQIAGVEYVVDNDEEEDEGKEEEEREVAEEEDKAKANKHNTKKRKAQDMEEEEEEEDISQDAEDEEEEEEGYFSSSSVEATSRFMVSMLHSTAGRHDATKKHLQYFVPQITHRVHPNVWQTTQSTPTQSQTSPTEVEEGTTTKGDDQYEPVTKYVGVTTSPTTTGGEGGCGIIPQSLYKGLCKVFAPTASYWEESDYNHRGYYSYYVDKPTATGEGGEASPTSKFQVSNLIDDVIWNHLYPIVLRKQQQEQQKGGSSGKDNVIVGAEWWVHTRSISANLGHNLHFDTDEALLQQEEKITHPLYSSVLYLTGGGSGGGASGGDGGGATVVFDQTPNSQQVATKAWKCTPQNNTLLVFDGQLLHGVLPCPGPTTTAAAASAGAAAAGQVKSMSSKSSEAAKNEDDNGVSVDTIQDQWISSSTSSPPPGDDDDTATAAPPTKHRLTLLVGFWTRRVPDKMKNRRLYGPCGPLPPRPTTTTTNNGRNKTTGSMDDDHDDDDEEEEQQQQHTWVEEIHEGYDNNDNDNNKHTLTKEVPKTTTTTTPTKITTVSVPVITPAWETLHQPSVEAPEEKDNDDDDDDEAVTGTRKTPLLLLEIPRGIDHRFFVRDAPKCFRDSLFEKNDDEDDDDDDIEIVILEEEGEEEAEVDEEGMKQGTE